MNSWGGAGLNIKNVIVWNKIVHGLNYQNYAYTYELIIYCTKGNFKLNNKTKQDMVKGFYKDVWNIQRKISTQNNGEHHETQKHDAVLKIPLLHTTQEGDTVLDCFMGSGTTGIVCKELKRNFIGIEIREDYFNISQNRINQTVEYLL